MNKGLVIKTTGSWYYVLDGNKTIPCKIKGKFRIKGIRATNPVAVGDYVEYENSTEENGVITGIQERKNYIIRRSPNLSREYQLIAANIDQAWLIASLKSPRTFTEFIDRFLVTTEAYSIPANIVFNKTDLYSAGEQEELKLLMAVYRDIGYSVYSTSVFNPESLEALKNSMKNSINLLSGNSGVGKSSIINTIDKNLDLRTGDISRAHSSGRHTTTFAEMHSLSFGGSVIDTPGIRGFGLIDFDKDELFHYFPEIFEVSHDCRFNNCSHIHEPGCAVRDAVEEGRIFIDRYSSYVSLMSDSENKYR